MYAMSGVNERKGKNANNQNFFFMSISDFLFFSSDDVISTYHKRKFWI